MRDFFQFLITLVFSAILFAGVVSLMVGVVAYGLERTACYAKWENSGMKVHWSFFGDCQLQQSDGAWLPEYAYLALNKNVNLKQH